MRTETLERDDEITRIGEALDAAAGGAGRLVVIEGPPGIGKTRLVEDARALAKEKGFGRLVATGDEPERTLPWGVIRQLVERSILRYHGETRRRILEGPAGDALTALDLALENPQRDEASQARTLHALWWVAADLAAERPLLLSVDDAQWADAPSLRYLAYLARRLVDLPIALVVGTRPPETTEGPLVDLTAGRAGLRIVPQPLSPVGLARFARRNGARPAPAVVEALHTASGGNPFLAGQLLDELESLGRPLERSHTADVVRSLGPRTVSRALLTRLPPDAVALARAAAVLGARADQGLAAALAGLDAVSATTAADTLVQGGVLRDEPGHLAFVHPVIREALLQELQTGERGQLHAEAARRLHATGAPPGRVATHLAVAPAFTLPGAGAILGTAADEALAEGDPATAADYLQRALDEEPGDVGLCARLGLALLDAGRHQLASERLLAAARGTEEPVARAELLAAAAFATLAVEGPTAATRRLRADLEAFGDEPDATAALILEERLAFCSGFVPEEFSRSGRRLRRFADLAGATPQERAVLAMVAQRAYSECRPGPEVRDVAARALGDGALLADAGVANIGWGIAVHAALFADAVEVVEREHALACDTLLQRGSPLHFAMTSVVGAYIAWRAGDVARCESEATAAADALAPGDGGPAQMGIRPMVLRVLVLALLERGDRAAAATALEEFDASVAGMPLTVPLARLGHARAALALADDDPARARQEAEALGAFEAEARIENPTTGWRPIAALAAMRLGDEEASQELAAAQLALARRWDVPSDVGAALRLVARIGPGDRVALLEDAVAVLEQARSRLELAGALCDLGEALRVERRRRDAAEPLTRAIELADALGARVLQTRAHDALASLGAQPRKLMFSGHEALTASERRVAEMAAAGRSNREIAQELFVSPKTVENHLGRVYGKLSLGGRRELSAALTPSG